jgi:hypothetical protein
MAETNFNLFALSSNPLLVREIIAKHYPAAVFDTPSGDWSGAEYQSKGLLRRKPVVSFNHDREYYSEPGWSKQLAGMAGYFSQGEPSAHQRMVVEQVIPRFVFSMACIYHAEPQRQDFEFLGELCQQLEGFIFNGSSLIDAAGNCVLRVDGYSDPDASFPASLYTPPPQEPVSSEQARGRSLALGAVVMRGILERDLDGLDDPEELHQRLMTWINERGVASHLEESEMELVSSPPGSLDSQQTIDSMWQVEGLEVLLWALQMKDMPSCDELSDVDTPLNLLGIWKPSTESSVANAELRPIDELETQQAVQLTIHWRLREQGLRPKHMNLPVFIEQAKFGPLSLQGVPLIDDDLAIRGLPLNQAAPELRGLASSIASERHRAANWLMWGGSWCETDTST